MTAIGLSALGGPAQGVEPTPTSGPGYDLPFRCGETWVGSTRAAHRPHRNSVDFNRSRDLGALLVAPAPGYVSRVANAGDRSYGRWLVIDHGDTHSTLYAHLKATWVVVGQRLDQGDPIGLVGASGGVSGAHLHYEQKLGKDVVPAVFAGQALVYDKPVASANCPDVPTTGDWDGTARDDVGVFRRTAGPGTFEHPAADGTVASLTFRRGSDTPVVGDWDGDGTDEVGIRRPRARAFHLRLADGKVRRQRMGRIRDLPVIGDWDGNGADDLGLWRPAKRLFLLRRPDGTMQRIRLGSRSSTPVAGDWNGDGVDDVGVHDAATTTFTLRTPGTDPETGAPTVALTTLRYGTTTDLPVAGDWNGNGVDDVGVWTPGTATWSLRTPRVRRPARSRTRQLVFGVPR